MNDSLRRKESLSRPSVCPGCGSCAPTFAVGAGPSFEQWAGSAQFIQPCYEVHECVECGLLFKRPSPSPDMLKNYYECVSHERWHFEGLFPTEQHVLGLVGLLAPGSSVLDFGCSSGRLLSRVSPDIFRFGFEINKTASLEAASKGIVMLSQEQLDQQCLCRFDMVLLVDVFEHLDSPALLLKKLWAMIRPGGSLIVSTGNGDYWACRLNPARHWYFQNYEHLCMLTGAYASYLSRMFGQSLGQWKELSHYEVPVKQRILIWLVFLRDVARKRLWRVRFGGDEAAWRRSSAFSNPSPTCAIGADHVVAVWNKP